jgi:hypothetical protein
MMRVRGGIEHVANSQTPAEALFLIGSAIRRGRDARGEAPTWHARRQRRRPGVGAVNESGTARAGEELLCG